MSGVYLGRRCIEKDDSIFRPKYYNDRNRWYAIGNFMRCNYTVMDASGHEAVEITQDIFHTTAWYTIDVAEPKDADDALIFTLALHILKNLKGGY